MIKKTVLKAQPRAERGKGDARRFRAAGRLPAILYGKEMEPRALSLDLQEAETLFERISVENTILDLEIEGDDQPVQALIREIQSYPHKPGLLHVDFLRIQKGVAVEVEIPVSLEGIPVGVRESGGVLEQIINELRVKCIPSKIPEVVSIDVAGMDIGDAIHVYDIDLGEGVGILVDPERTVCSVQIPKVVTVEEEVPEEELAEVLEEGEVPPEEEASEEEGGAEGEEA